jgi:hypothetical protein
MILRKMVDDASSYLGEKITKAVITVLLILMTHSVRQLKMQGRLQALKF